MSSRSTKAFDLGAKKDRYADEGTPEFWFVDLDADSVLKFVVDSDGNYAAPVVHRRGKTFTSALFPGLVLDVDDLLGPPEEPPRATA